MVILVRVERLLPVKISITVSEKERAVWYRVTAVPSNADEKHGVPLVGYHICIQEHYHKQKINPWGQAGYK